MVHSAHSLTRALTLCHKLAPTYTHSRAHKCTHTISFSNTRARTHARMHACTRASKQTYTTAHNLPFSLFLSHTQTTHTQARTHACPRTNAHARTHAHTHTHTHACTHAHTHAHTHTLTHTHTHTHIHTLMHRRRTWYFARAVPASCEEAVASALAMPHLAAATARPQCAARMSPTELSG